jgi:hypothetical protein
MPATPTPAEVPPAPATPGHAAAPDRPATPAGVDASPSEIPNFRSDIPSAPPSRPAPAVPAHLEPALLCALADESVPLPALSERFGIPLETIAAWTMRPEVAARLELVIQLARTRARLLCAERASAAIHTLDHVQTLLFSSDLSDARPSTKVALAESARRAATTVLKHAGLADDQEDPQPPRGTGVPPASVTPQPPTPQKNPRPPTPPPPPSPPPESPAPNPTLPSNPRPSASSPPSEPSEFPPFRPDPQPQKQQPPPHQRGLSDSLHSGVRSVPVGPVIAHQPPRPPPPPPPPYPPPPPPP